MVKKDDFIHIRVERERLVPAEDLARILDISCAEIIRNGLPDENLLGLFIQSRKFYPDLQWKDVVRIGVIEYLNALFMEGVEMNAKRTEQLKELEAAKISGPQLKEAYANPRFLQVLYEGYVSAKKNQDGFELAEIRAGFDGEAPQTIGYFVKKDGQIFLPD